MIPQHQSSFQTLLDSSIRTLKQALRVDGARDASKPPEAPLTRRFWAAAANDTAAPRVNAPLEGARSAFTSTAGTFSSSMRDLERRLHTQSLKLGAHKFPAVPADARSRCPGPGSADFQLTELQRAAQVFFVPGVDPELRRVMVELTPGMGKTCVYMEVISKFIGKVNPETGNYFNIIVLGDDEVFAAFESLRSCPAKVSVQEIVAWNSKFSTDPQKPFTKVFQRRVFDPPVGRDVDIVELKTINRSAPSASCALNTRLTTARRAQAASAFGTPVAATKGRGRAGARAQGPNSIDAPVDVPVETSAQERARFEDAKKGFAPAAAVKTPPADFEEKKGEAACGQNATVWNGSKVLFLPYKFAARWIVLSNQSLLDANDDTQSLSSTDRKLLAQDLKRFLPAKKQTASGKYKQPGLIGASSDTVFIIDEVQNLTSPAEWRHSLAKKEAPALSEALWRWTNKDPKLMPYIFAGTATPNTTTNPELTVCLLQLLNGKSNKQLFIPRWKGTDGTLLPEKDCSLKAFRAILDDPIKRETTEFFWPDYEARRAERLIVYPKKFLDASQGFVTDVTSASSPPTPFSLLEPKGVVKDGIADFDWNSSRMTCQQAAALVRERKLLPRDAPDTSRLGAYQDRKAKPDFKSIADFEEYLAYRGVPCAIGPEDAAFQYSRIYKPVYSDVNRQFLQQLVAGHVFTANSYFDYRVYPKILPLGVEAVRPRTRLVDPFSLLKCLPRAKGDAGFAPDLQRKPASTTPRMRAEAAFPAATVIASDGKAQMQFPWFVPKDAATGFLKQLKKEPTVCKSCRWGERSLYADVDGLSALAEACVTSYLRDPDMVDVALENRLRDIVAVNSPKLVAAADDMYATQQFAPDLEAQSKTFFFLNVESRKELDSNIFVVVASFYLRMRCRPYLQSIFLANPRQLPRAYRDGKKTVQHRIAWLDAIALLGGGYEWLKSKAEAERAGGASSFAARKTSKCDQTDWCPGQTCSAAETVFPPFNKTGATDPDPSIQQWSSFWRTWLKGYGLNRVVAQRTRAPPGTSKALRAPGAAKPTLLTKERQRRKRQRSSDLTSRQRSFYMPAIFAVGDTTMTPAQSKAVHQKLYFNMMPKLLDDPILKDPGFAATRDKEWKDRFSFEALRQQAPVLTFDDIVQLIGSPGLREAMVKVGMGCEPCVSSANSKTAAPAGQSMIFAGKAAHKALDFKCTGLNVAFGPQPRGQRIQELGRNWRTCVNLPAVALRQLFLWGDGDDELLRSDLLLDSFYEAQNEPINWLRLITISASLGCSLWWGYSQWKDLLKSYQMMRPKETAWFFDPKPRGSTPCLDDRPSTKVRGHEEGLVSKQATPFWRCNRSDIFSVMFLDEKTKEFGRIVPSRCGAFRPSEIVSDAVIDDPTCPRGSGVEMNAIPGASRKVCLSASEAKALDAGKTVLPLRKPMRLSDLRPKRKKGSSRVAPQPPRSAPKVLAASPRSSSSSVSSFSSLASSSAPGRRKIFRGAASSLAADSAADGANKGDEAPTTSLGGAIGALPQRVPTSQAGKTSGSSEALEDKAAAPAALQVLTKSSSRGEAAGAFDARPLPSPPPPAPSDARRAAGAAITRTAGADEARRRRLAQARERAFEIEQVLQARQRR